MAKSKDNTLFLSLFIISLLFIFALLFVNFSVKSSEKYKLATSRYTNRPPPRPMNQDNYIPMEDM